jgi:hypothetical protein
VSLSDEDTGVMDGLGESKFEDLSLQSSFQEIFDLKTEHVIELHAVFVQHTDTNETTQECVTLNAKIVQTYVEMVNEMGNCNERVSYSV